MTRGEHVHIACASRPHPGFPVPGELGFSRDLPDGAVLAVVDGAGHGLEARAAAQAAERVLAANPDRPVNDLVNLCHAGLKGTRGAALTIAALDARSRMVSWAGVGNVAALLLRRYPGGRPAREHLRNVAGVVGYRMGKLRNAWVDVSPGDLLVLVTDGIDHAWEQAVDPSRALDELAPDLLARFARPNDDATVMVARLLPNLAGGLSS